MGSVGARAGAHASIAGSVFVCGCTLVYVVVYVPSRSMHNFKCFFRRVKQKHDLFLVRKVLSKVSESQMARKLQVVCKS